MYRLFILSLFLATQLLTLTLGAAEKNTQTTQSPLKRPNSLPNIVVIWGDDIGQSNLSIYTKGLMGYQTPNIDRIAQEGMLFTDYYAEQSCTAGRAAKAASFSIDQVLESLKQPIQ